MNVTCFDSYHTESNVSILGHNGNTLLVGSGHWHAWVRRHSCPRNNAKALVMEAVRQCESIKPPIGVWLTMDSRGTYRKCVGLRLLSLLRVLAGCACCVAHFTCDAPLTKTRTPAV